ncbi:reverse transcriptase domain-containing protein [Tanacetum coccineum]
MADNTVPWAQMLQAPIEGYEDAIIVPPINANNFELKQTLINLVQSNQFTGKQDPHNHLRFFNKIALDSAAGGNFLDKMPRDGLAIIESKSKVRYSRSRANDSRVSTNAHPSTSSPSNSFEFQQLAASLEDKMDIRMSRLEKAISEKQLTPATVKHRGTCALADSGASINLLPNSSTKQLGLGALTPTRMTLELANRSITHPMGIAEDVVVRVDGFTFLADFVVVNFEPDPRVPIILGRPFLRTAKALIDLYEEKLTLRVGSDELVFYAEKSEKSKNKQFAHAISVIDFSKDEPFVGSTNYHFMLFLTSSSPVKSSEKSENVINKNSNVSDEPVLLNTPLSDKVESFAPEDDIDEIEAFSLAIRKYLLFLRRIVRKHEDYLNHMTLLCEISTSRSQENVYANQSSIIESLPVSPIPVEDSEPVQEEIDIFLVLDDLIPPGVENDDSEDEDNELPNLDHQDNPSSPRPTGTTGVCLDKPNNGYREMKY